MQRVLQDEDLVGVHSSVKQKPDDLGAALVHIFRFQGNLIAELWDFGQAVRENLPNQHGVFQRWHKKTPFESTTSGRWRLALTRIER
jgi:hypothetical protein